jgi:hypothetical protein
VSVIPLLTKQPNEILEALKQGFNKMGGTPETIYSDNEGSLNAYIIIKYLEDKIEWFRSIFQKVMEFLQSL